MIQAIMLICFTVCSSIYADKSLSIQQITPENIERLQLVSVENKTMDSEFSVFVGMQDSYGLVRAESKMSFDKPVGIAQDDVTRLVCVKGSYLPVYVQDQGKTSGNVPFGYEGPYYMSMWLQYPYVSQAQRVHVPYVIKKGKKGQIGLQISPTGDCRIVGVKNIKLLYDGHDDHHPEKVISHHESSDSVTPHESQDRAVHAEEQIKKVLQKNKKHREKMEAHRKQVKKAIEKAHKQHAQMPKKIDPKDMTLQHVAVTKK